ncbi:hypothetical protein [Colidextribacter sp. OB.20]|uniref:hypothetical protein n=1 Tax=Colidextribacter sp. OB.20 TaxID=2304568 RepID=UPI00136CE63E|nr:hypothetical protein [Colidextribacter sp. OB.20]
MKRKRFISLFMAAVCMFLFAVPAFATTRASIQINQYDMKVTPVAGTLNIYFSVVGNNGMDKIGCESIYVYEKSGSRWVLTDSWDEDDDGMSRTDSAFKTNTIYCDSEAGVEYKVVVTIFAENSAGRDSRTRTIYVTGR